MQRGWVVSADYRSAIETITAARQSLRLSQREVARRLGKPPSFINKIELYERRLDLLEFIAIAQAMGLSPVDLLSKVVSQLPAQVTISR